MPSHYKKKHFGHESRSPHPYSWNNHTGNRDRRYYSRFSYEHRTNVRYFQLSHSSQQQLQPQEQMDILPLPDGPLFERTLLNPIWKNTRTIGPGFINSKNNCFVNSVLECLTYTPSLAQYFLYHGHRTKCTTIGFCAMCAMDDHVHRCLVESKSLLQGAILPRDFLSNLQVFSQTLRLGKQEDAHEFMMCLLDSMNKSTVQGYGKLDAKVERTTFIYQIFGGQIRSQLRCCNCNTKSDTFDNFLDLSIDLQNATSIQEALENFTKVDSIGNDDFDSKYQCETCGQKVDAQKKMTIHELPSYLCVHLKRFAYEMNSGCMKKMTEDIQYQEVLDMAPFVSEDAHCASTIYYLYAVLVHIGYNCDVGHYLSYVMAPDGEWFRMDDDMVTHVSLNEVLSQQAYMLFYTTEKQVNHSMDINNESNLMDDFLHDATNETTPIYEQGKMNSMDMSLALNAATTSAVVPNSPPFDNTYGSNTTIHETMFSVSQEDTTYGNDTAIHGNMSFSFGNVTELQSLASEGEETDEYDHYLTDAYSNCMIPVSRKPIRSLHGNMSPPILSATVNDISCWPIQDQVELNQPYFGEACMANEIHDSDASLAYWWYLYGQENHFDY